MKPFKTKSQRIYKNVAISWYGEIIKNNNNKFYKNKNPFIYFNYVAIGHKTFDKWKKKYFKRIFENKVQFWPFKSS